MKRISIVLFMLFMLSSLAFGQNGFKPMFDKPAEFAQINDSEAWVQGHWIDAPGSPAHMAGPSASVIYCDKAEKTCTDTQANISVSGGMFDLASAVTEYTVERWTSKEIVAVVEGRAPCHLRQTLKIDRVAKKIFWMMYLSEPLDPSLPDMTAKMCALGTMSLELKDGTAWGVK
jgi:hypothetical protein